MKVLDSKVLIKAEKGLTQKVAGGFEIPMDSDVMIANVIEVGEDIDQKFLSPGNQIYAYPGSGTPIHHEGVEYRVINKTDIIAVINK